MKTLSLMLILFSSLALAAGEGEGTGTATYPSDGEANVSSAPCNCTHASEPTLATAVTPQNAVLPTGAPIAKPAGKAGSAKADQ